MKTANKIFYSVMLTKLLAIGLVIFAATSQSKLNTQINLDGGLAADTTPTLKLASVKQIQTVVISAKRLRPDEKLAIDLNHARTMQANVQFNKKIRKIA
jgi:hypothetical protein